MKSKLDEIMQNQLDQKEIKKQLQQVVGETMKAYLLNKSRVKPNKDIENKLLNIIELVRDCLFDLDTEFLADR